MQLKDYLFGEFGILNPDPPAFRLWTFIAVGTLLAFFFEGYLLKGGAGGTHKINYALAIILASNVARAGISLSSVVLLGEAIFTIVLAEALKGTAPNVKGFGTNWILAGFLVGWASAAMTYGTDYQGWLASFVGTPLYYMGFISADPAGAVARPSGTGSWFGWIGKMGIGALIIGLLLLLLFFLMFRGENKVLLRAIRERYGRVIWNKLKDSAARGVLNWIFFWVKWPKRETPKDMLHQIFLENMHIFQALNNWMKRLFIFFSKWDQVREAQGEISNSYTAMGKHLDEVLLTQELKFYRTGGGEVTKRDEEGNITGEKVDVGGGWFGYNKEMMELINEIMDFIQTYIALSVEHGVFGTPEYIGPTDQRWNPVAEKARGLVSRLGTVLGKIQTYSKETKERLKHYGPHHVVRAWRHLILDQCSPSGNKWPHTYLFVPARTELEDGTFTTELTEVNMFGELLEDIYKNIDHFGKPKSLQSFIKPRKVKDRRKIAYYQDPHQMMSFIDHDWEGFVRDMRFGEYHPYSRSVNDYISKMVYKKIFYDDSKITATLPSLKTPDNPAFDREGLKNPGQMFYWGKTRYSDKHTDIEPKNPYPTISNFGMTRYLRTLVEKDMADKQEALSFMNRFLGDTGEWVTTAKQAKEAIGLLGEVK
ncbi:MAG: hypothetical protein AABW61_01225, partial [Candidatus Aenigmatarchaeota archaeon]